MKTTLLIVLGLVAALNINAQTFRAKEVSLDIFGAYESDQSGPTSASINSLTTDTEFRGGVGLNYFLTRHLGVGVDTHFSDLRGALVDNLSASVILRAPIESIRTAPYFFGGGGGNFEGSDYWTYHAGLGVDVRVFRHVGAFGDVRYTWGEGGRDTGLLRTGIRVIF